VSCGVATFLNDLLKIIGDCVGKLAEDDRVYPVLAWVVGEDIIGLDVVGVSLQGQHHVVMPSGVVGGHGVQNYVHEGMNIQHRSRLDVEVGDDGVFIRRRVGHGLHC
jgi:hypothetical protein